MYCKKCGKELANTALFCNSCGTKTGITSDSAKKLPIPKPIIVTGGLMCFISLLLIGASILSTDNNQNKKEEVFVTTELASESIAKVQENTKLASESIAKVQENTESASESIAKVQENTESASESIAEIPEELTLQEQLSQAISLYYVDYATAEQELRRIVEANKKNVEMYHFLSEWSLGLGKINEAKKFLIEGFHETEDISLMEECLDITLEYAPDGNGKTYKTLLAIAESFAQETDNSQKLELAKSLYYLIELTLHE